MHIVSSRTVVVGFLTAVATLLSPSLAGAQEPTTTVPPTPPAVPAPVPAPTPPPVPVGPTGLALLGPALGPGSTGVEVAFVQFTLLRRGFWVSEQLGRYGESTRHAVVAFQKYHGLPRTGKVDFWTRLGLAISLDRAAPLRPGAGHRIDVDLARQVMVIATDGNVDGVFDISSGKRSTPTPRGSFRLQREIKGRRVSKLGVLISPKYFTGGYAIHGSPSVPAHAASHGCVRLTNQAIAHLWASGLVPLGTPITIG